MKQLISAEVVRSEHAAGKREIAVTRNGHIVTPEARTVAEALGVLIREGEAKAGAAPHCGAPPTRRGRSPTGLASTGHPSFIASENTTGILSIRDGISR